MRFIITGGNGFIGAFLVKKMLEDGHEVRVVDSADCSGAVEVGCNKTDVRDLEDLKKNFKDGECVIHLAAYSKIKDCIKNPEMAFRVNVGGTLNVLLAAKDCGVRRVIYASSSSVYGDQMTLPFKEDGPVRLLNPYAATKYEGERLCGEFAKWCDLETVSLRLFNVYGSDAAVKGEADCPSVVELFLRQRKLGQRLTVIGDGQQRRDFVYVEDTAAAFAAAANSSLVGQGEVINIGSGVSHSVSEIAKLVGGETVSVDERYAEAQATLADITQAQKLLGWQPRHNLREWIKSMVYAQK